MPMKFNSTKYARQPIAFKKTLMFRVDTFFLKLSVLKAIFLIQLVWLAVRFAQWNVRCGGVLGGSAAVMTCRYLHRPPCDDTHLKGSFAKTDISVFYLIFQKYILSLCSQRNINQTGVGSFLLRIAFLLFLNYLMLCEFKK